MPSIDEQIKQKQEELAKLMELKAKQSAVMELHEYTDQQKIELFEKCYNFARGIVKTLEDGTYHEDNDNDHWAYETIMEILARDGDTDAMYSYLNSLNSDY